MTIELGLSYNTITLYVSAIRDWASDSGLEDPLASHSFNQRRYKKFMRGVRRFCRARIRVRLPLKKREMVRVLKAIPNSGLEQKERTMLKAAILMAFYGLLRVSEYTFSAAKASTCLRRRDIRFIKSSDNAGFRVKLRLRCTKTSQFENSTFVDIFPTNTQLCPVQAIYDYYQLNHGMHSQQPFLWSAGRPLSSARFNKLLRIALQNGGLNPKLYSSHSLRSGAATVAANKGVPEWVIQRLGRWKSQCFKIYIKSIKNNVRLAHKAMSF